MSSMIVGISSLLYSVTPSKPLTFRRFRNQTSIVMGSPLKRYELECSGSGCYDAIETIRDLYRKNIIIVRVVEVQSNKSEFE